MDQERQRNVIPLNLIELSLMRYGAAGLHNEAMCSQIDEFGRTQETLLV